MPDLDAPVYPTALRADTSVLEQAIPFRFSVTWKAVFDPLEAAASPSPPAATDDPVHTRVAALSRDSSLIVPVLGDKPAAETAAIGTKKPSPGGSVQWEMVVPKMIRTTAKKTYRGGLKSLSTPKAVERETVEESVPGFCAVSDSPSSRTVQSFVSPKYIVFVSVGLLAIGVPIWKHLGSARKDGLEIQASTRAGGWAREAVTRIDPGFNRSRELVIYRPSLKATDGRFEFDWKPTTTALGWVFRARDTANYYAMTIKLIREQPTPTISIGHFTVYRGIESGRAEKVLVLQRGEPKLRIRTEIAGPAFTVYVGTNAAEYWTDARIVSGGLGFFEEWRQGSDVQSVRMSFAPGTEIQRDSLYTGASVH